MNCKECSNYKGRYELAGLFKGSIQCGLDNAFHSPNGENANNCSWYNVDLSNKDICYNCKHFLGGGDWGLACKKHYHWLPETISEICEDYERK